MNSNINVLSSYQTEAIVGSHWFQEDVLGKWGMIKGVVCNDGIVVLLIRRGRMILILGMPWPAPENRDQTLFSASERAKWPEHLMLM